MENKQGLCNDLCRLLRKTDNASDIVKISYDPLEETATVLFDSGGTRVINVAMDSGTAMIRDIVNHLGC